MKDKPVKRRRTSYAEEAFAVQAQDVPGWVREYRFAPPRRWRFDFAWPAAMVALEIEGGLWVSGRHTRGAGFEADCEKYAAATLLGWRVFRASPRQVRDGTALDWIRQALGEVKRG